MSQVYGANSAGIASHAAAQSSRQRTDVREAAPALASRDAEAPASSETASRTKPGPMPAPVAVPTLGSISVSPSLPVTDEVPRSLTRLTLDSDRDIARGRRESALDLTLLGLSSEPGFLPLFVRQAELLLATGRVDAAVAIARSGLRLIEISAQNEYEVDFIRVLTHADSSDSNLVRLATTVLNAARVDLAADYVPIAVDRLALGGDHERALDIATHWHNIQPEYPDALYLYARELTRSDLIAEATTLLANEAMLRRDARLAVARLAILARNDDPQHWILGIKIAHAIRDGQIDAQPPCEALRQFAGIFPESGTLRVHLGRFELEAGRFGPAQSHLMSAGTLDDQTAYMSLLAGARAATGAGNLPAASTALLRAAEIFCRPELTSFVTNLTFFQPPDDIASIGQGVADQLLTHGGIPEATALLARLIEIVPDHAGLMRRYGEALGKSGQRDAALRVLERVLEQQEKARDGDGSMQTLQAIVHLAPGNIRLRNKLIERLMKRGKLAEAVSERVAVAKLLDRAGHQEEAITQFREAAAVAKMTNDGATVEKILLHTIRVRPSDLNLRHSAVTTFIELGRINLAVQQLWDVVRITVTDDNSDEAIAALHQIIALAPGDLDAYHKLGEILASVGEFQQAERVYRRLSALAPDDPAIRAKQSALAALSKDQENAAGESST